jgi:hypothetical protein
VIPADFYGDRDAAEAIVMTQVIMVLVGKHFQMPDSVDDHA